METTQVIVSTNLATTKSEAPGLLVVSGQPLARDMRLLGHGGSMRKRYNLQVASEERI